MNAIFVELASRIAAMTPQGVEEETFYNFAFGAVHSLARAEELGYQASENEKNKSAVRAKEVRDIAGRVANNGPLQTEGKWLAGYYYNDALVRTDVCFEHLLRTWTRMKSERSIHPVIVKALKDGFEASLLVPWCPRIRDEVNKLKHRSWQFGEGPPMKYEEAIDAIRHLIGCVEWVLNHPAVPH